MVDFRTLALSLAVELERMNERHGCGQIECSLAMDVIAQAREAFGLRRNEPFPPPSQYAASEGAEQ